MSRFVSAGAINAETGEAVANEADKTANTTQPPAAESKKTAEWELVQKELDAERRRREEARIKAVEGGEKSLYDVLQANKGEFFRRVSVSIMFSVLTLFCVKTL